MGHKGEDVSPVTLNDSHDLKVKNQLRHLSHRFTIFQRRQLEKAFKKDQHLTAKTREALVSSTGLLSKQIQIWFKHRRIKWQRENKIMIKSPNSSPKKQIDKMKEIRKLNCKIINLKKEYIQQLMSMKKELNLERRKSTNLNKTLNNLRCKYDYLVSNRIPRELKERNFIIYGLSDKIQKLNLELAHLEDFRDRIVRVYLRNTSI